MDRRAQGPLDLWLDCCPLPLSSCCQCLSGSPCQVCGFACSCWWMVSGMFVGGCFVFWFCYLPFVVVTLAPFFDAQMFNGFQEKRFENLPSRDSLKVGCLGSKDEPFWLTTQVLEELEGLCTCRSPSLEASRGERTTPPFCYRRKVSLPCGFLVSSKEFRRLKFKNWKV